MKSSAPLLLSMLLGALGALAACGSDSPSKPPEHGPVHACTGEYLCPPIAYTGYDGQSTFKTPFSTSLTNPKWTLADPTIGEIYVVNAPQSYGDYGASWAMVETFKAGETDVYAEQDGKKLVAHLVVSQYDPAVVSAGATRYYTPANAGGKREACATCHQSVQGADHSPLEMEVFKDDELLQAITLGAYPDGYVLMNVDHRWDLTDQERAGIVPYLRSLAPKGFF